MERSKLIYLLNFITNALINFDHGIIPACTTDLKRDLQIDDIEDLWDHQYMQDQQLDLQLEQEYLINSKQKIQSKIVFYCQQLVYLFLFLLRIYTYYLFLAFQLDFFKYAILYQLVFLVIFFPVWIDFYGETKKTLWLTYMQLGVALGTVSGYLITSLSVHYIQSWVYPYYLQILLLIPCLITYFRCEEFELTTKQKETNNESSLPCDQSKLGFSDILIQNLKTFFGNPLFVFTMLSLSSLFFVVTGIQFWITDYLRVVLHMPHQIVFNSFLIISLTAPLSGVYIGGIILHKFGGYDGIYAMQIVAAEAFLASISGLFIPLLNTGWLVLIFLWFLLFFGGSAVPAIMGIMITSIPKEQRSSGNSLSHLFQELLGYLPAPMLYGYVQSITGGQTSRWGMGLLSFWGFLGFLHILIAMYYKKQNPANESINDSELKDEVNFHTLPKSNKNIQQNQKDFGYLRMVSSIQSAKSEFISKEQESSEENNATPLLKNIEQKRVHNTFKKQESITQAFYNFSSLIGRGSLDPDNFMIKDDFFKSKKTKGSQDIELQVSGDLYLVSEGRYIHQNK